MTWSGRHRAPLEHAGVWPRPVQDPLPVWVAVGGTPQSVVRAGALGLPLTLAIIGGQPERFVPLVELYREAFAAAGHDPADGQVAINTHAFVGATAARGQQRVRRLLSGDDEPHRPRARLAAVGRPEYDALRSPRGALAVGSPEQVAEKILFEHELFANDRYVGADERRRRRAQGRDALDRAVRHRVAPFVRAEVGRAGPNRAPPDATRAFDRSQGAHDADQHPGRLVDHVVARGRSTSKPASRNTRSFSRSF